MADDNKPMKYARYAIGEIVLVVIGILIALQINTWNEDRKSKFEEKRILEGIYVEFEKNQQMLESCMNTNMVAQQNMLLIMNCIGKEESELKQVNLDHLLLLSFDHKKYFPSQHSLNELIQSGKMQYLSNLKLKALLNAWSSSMDQMDDMFDNVDRKVEDDIIPYLSKKYPLKDMDMYGHLAWKEPSVLSSNKFSILKELEFENLIDDNMYRMKNYIKSLHKLENLIDDIIKESQQYKNE